MIEKYWCNEDNKVYTIDDIMRDYPEFKNEYQTPEEYLSCCMWYNNGALYALSDRIQKVERDINRKKATGKKYGFEYVEEELSELRAELSELNRLYFET